MQQHIDTYELLRDTYTDDEFYRHFIMMLRELTAAERDYMLDYDKAYDA